MKARLRFFRRMGAVLFAVLFLGWHALPVLAAPTAAPVRKELPPDGPSGVNLAPIVRNFYLAQASFTRGSHDVLDECITPGQHVLLRFDMLVHNKGDLDLVMGSPKDRPELFVFSRSHDHIHLKDFNDYRLYNLGGEQVSQGYKQTFCLFDSRRLLTWARRSMQFPSAGCDTLQGISAGWADLYRGSLPCQYVPVTGLEAGDYALLATVNAQHVVREMDYTDNTVCVGLRLEGSTATRIDHPVCAGEPSQNEPVAPLVEMD